MRRMKRGKRQVLLNYLPGKTFDFERVGSIARVSGIRGEIRTDLNMNVVLRRVREHATGLGGWPTELRPVLSEATLNDPKRFILIDPTSVQSQLFPLVLWCQNRSCGRIWDVSNRNSLPRNCSDCSGDLVQMRHVKIHRCGALEPLVPSSCGRCRSTRIALDTRGSERISQFRWVCRQCRNQWELSGGNCRECSGTNWGELSNGALNGEMARRMDIEVHRAKRTYYPHSITLLNVPTRRLDGFFASPDRAGLVAAKFLSLPQVAGRSLLELATQAEPSQTGQDRSISDNELSQLMTLSNDDAMEAMRALLTRRQQERQAESPSAIVAALLERSGVGLATWEAAESDLLDAVLLRESETLRALSSESGIAVRGAQSTSTQLGFGEVAVISDFPVVTATYGFSRADYEPRLCRLNPFPPQTEHGGRWPILVDEVRADALWIQLDKVRVARWLTANGFAPSFPNGTDPEISRSAYFVQLFDDAPAGVTLGADQAQARMVFGLLHTLSHFCLRQAALGCGLDATSLSEYVLPRALSFALYCNHRDGATIGALTALFEQTTESWLRAVREARRCVYDPECWGRGGNCHACTHLAETSCKFFNLNLSRAFMFGGPDAQLGNLAVGYFDPSLANE